jgi:hypothetical protein
VVVIDLLSSDDEKEDAKENKKNTTLEKKHPLSAGNVVGKRKCLCCSFPGEFCQKI